MTDEVIFLREEVTESAALLIGMTIVWFFVEVMEYSFFALLCHISMIVILVTYTRIWLITTFYWYNYLFMILPSFFFFFMYN